MFYTQNAIYSTIATHDIHPIQELVEATMGACQVRVMLYGVCPEGYAARAASSIDPENCHGIINRQHKTGAQTATVARTEGTLSQVVMLVKLKKNPVFNNLGEIDERTSLYPVPKTQAGEASNPEEWKISDRLSIRSCAFDTMPGSKRNKEVSK